MATFKTAASNGIYAKLVITEQSQSVENNTTTLKWEVYMWNTTASPNWYMYDQHNIFRVKINNVSVLDTNDFGRVSLQYEQTESTARLITSGTTVIAHETDGTKKSVPVSFYAAQGWEYAYVWETSGTMNLTTIARASQPTLSASSVTLGSPVTIYTNRASTGFTHTLEYSIGSASGEIATDVGASQSWTPSKELARQFPNAQSGTVTITCKTYNGSTLIGSKPVLLSVKISSDMVPSVSATISEAASIPSGITGYIKSRSKLKITVSASGIYGSTIKSYKITANGATYTATPAVTGYLTTEGTNTITVTVTDSRGQSKTYSTTVTVLDYSPPRADMVNAFRANSSGVSDEEGSYMMVEVVSTITSLGGANGRSVTVETRPSGGIWTSREIYVSDGYEGFASWTHGGTIWVDTATSYEARVRVSDSFGSSSYYYATVSTASILMNIHVGENGVKDGMAIGKMAEKANTLQLGWDLELKGAPTADNHAATKQYVDSRSRRYGIYGMTTDYIEFVIPLHSLNNSDIQANFYCNGVFTLKRGNTLSKHGQIRIVSSKNYNSSLPWVHMDYDDVASKVDVVRYLKNGEYWCGLRLTEIYANFYDDCSYFEGETTTTWENNLISVIRIHNTNTGEILDSEVYNSMEALAYNDYDHYHTFANPVKAPYFTGDLHGNATYASGADKAVLLDIHNALTHNSSRSTQYSTWNGEMTGLTYVWGQAWKDTSISSDTGDLVLGLRPSTNSSGGTELCMMIDGDYYVMGYKVDYPVASSTVSGTSGIWNYVKYNSGIAMCWGNTGICNTAFTATWGNWYIHDYLFPAQRYPFDFAAKPQVFASQGKGGTTKCDWAIYSGGDAGGYPDTQYSPIYSASRPTTTGATVNLSLDLFAIGRWK